MGLWVCNRYSNGTRARSTQARNKKSSWEFPPVTTLNKLMQVRDTEGLKTCNGQELLLLLPQFVQQSTKHQPEYFGYGLAIPLMLKKMMSCYLDCHHPMLIHDSSAKK